MHQNDIRMHDSGDFVPGNVHPAMHGILIYIFFLLGGGGGIFTSMHFIFMHEKCMTLFIINNSTINSFSYLRLVRIDALKYLFQSEYMIIL